MELEGLKRCKNDLDGRQIQVDEITTDRHVSICKYIETHWDVKHSYDLWHIAKSKLMACIKQHYEYYVASVA